MRGGLNLEASIAYAANASCFGPDSFRYVATSGGVQSPSVAVALIAQAVPAQVAPLERSSFHRQPTRLVLRFSAVLDAAAAQDLADHRLVGAGRDGRLGTRDDVFSQLEGRPTTPRAGASPCRPGSCSPFGAGVARSSAAGPAG